jgi:exopolyphosphatase/guanosine-5'-triphosphate,3'-diphosphate pyrophosphatase
VTTVPPPGLKAADQTTPGAPVKAVVPGMAAEQAGRAIGRIRLRCIPDLTRSSLHGFIATGGNIETVADLAGLPSSTMGIHVLTTARLRSVIGMLAKSSCRDRVHKLKIRKDRADVILPAAMVYERLAEIAKVKSITVPYTGTKEGILFDMVDTLASRVEHERNSVAQLCAAALTLGKHYRFEHKHSLQVAHLAVSLFDQLAGIHKLAASDRKILMAAGILHDIGMFISYKGHHKHSFYLISQSELPGLSDRDMLVAANVARYHRKMDPSAAHEMYKRLSTNERRRVCAMASMLRIADALDRNHMQNVRGVRAFVAKPRLMLQPELIGNSHLDHWALEKKQRLFSRLFGLEVRVVSDIL